MSEPTGIQPTSDDLARDLTTDLKIIDQFYDDAQAGKRVMTMYYAGHHRAAIRRALAAERERDRLRAALEAALAHYGQAEQFGYAPTNELVVPAQMRAALAGKDATP